MMQALPAPVSFDEFIAWYPENSGNRYELRRGVIVEMPSPSGKHSQVAGGLSGLLYLEVTRSQVPAVIPRECIIRSTGRKSGYEPDVMVLDSIALANEPQWEKSSVIENGVSVRLVIEVVSTNWRDDYLIKLADYEALAIPEYWIVDYAALGGRRFIGNPKQPAISVYTLIDGEYQTEQFRGDDAIVSSAFPDLVLTAAQVFAVS